MDENETYETVQDDEKAEPKLRSYIESINLAEKLSEEELEKIGQDAKAGYELDNASREEWLRCVEKWTELAKLVARNKSWPWPNASNVKYPLLATASMQFAARAYPSLLPSDGRYVKARVVGKDPDGQKTQTAEAVSIYMSYQLCHEIEGWEEEMDRLLIMLPVIGTLFKKTYWDSVKKVNCSHVILPQHLVVDYWAKSLRDAERISEILFINERVYKEKTQSGLWLDVDLGDPSTQEHGDMEQPIPSRADETTPYVFVEQHTYLELDDDDYKEPYIVTFHRATGKVVRIVARYDDNSITYRDDDPKKIACIEPIQYYTKFGFIPNPDGSFYDIGFGILLGPVNESVNTLINQLVDSGTLNNMQSGFLGKGLRLRAGDHIFKPGEWKLINNTGDDLKKSILPLPSKEPSKVLFELLSLLIQSGKELASVAEIFTGKMPGQNTPATTTMASIEQGMKVFTAVYKRIYRSLGEEFKKLYRLNGIYMNPNTYVDFVGMPIGPDDFNEDSHRIIPGADPTAVSQTEKLMKAQGLMEMLQMGLPLDPIKVMIRMLEAQEQPNWQELIPQQILQTGQMPPPPPDPKLMAVQMKAQADQAKTQGDLQALAVKTEMEKQSKEAELAMKAQEHEMEMQHKSQDMQLQLESKQQMSNIMNAEAQAKAVQGLRQSEEQHQMALKQGDEGHQQKLEQGAEMSKAKVQQTKAQAKAKPSKGTK